VRPGNQAKKIEVKARTFHVIYIKIGQAPIVMIARLGTWFQTPLPVYFLVTVALSAVGLLHRVLYTAPKRMEASKK